MTKETNVKTIHKHYELRKDLVEKIESNTKGKFSTQKEGIEYYLNLGLEYEKELQNQDDIKIILNKCISDVKFIKKLLVQFYVNTGFISNSKISDNKGYQDFIKRSMKSDMSD